MVTTRRALHYFVFSILLLSSTAKLDLSNAKYTLRNTLLGWYAESSIPGSYIPLKIRRKHKRIRGDLNDIPTYSFGDHGINSPIWVHHTSPNSMFDNYTNVKFAQSTIAKLLWKGLSKLLDGVDDMALHSEADLDFLIIALHKVFECYEDFYIQVQQPYVCV